MFSTLLESTLTIFVNTEPVANLVDATWLSLPASSSGRSSFPLYIVSVSSEPSLAKTLVQSLGRNLNFSTRGAKIRLRLAGLLVIQNDTPLLVEHFDGQFGHAYHPNRGGVRLRSEEITHLLPFITAVLLCNADLSAMSGRLATASLTTLGVREASQ